MGALDHIAVVLHVDDDDLRRDVAFWIEACNIQLREHVAPAWGHILGPPPAVFFYDTGEGLPADAAAAVGIFRDAGNPEAAGYHANVGKLIIGAVDLSRSSSPQRTLSHESAEITGNPWLNAWVPGPGPAGRLYAQELCDPVQRNGYFIKATILGETREVFVGDFVTPEYFGLSGPNRGKYSYLGLPPKPFEVVAGGYQIALEGDNILYLPARGEAIGLSTITRPLSRTRQISNRVVVQPKEASKP